MSVVRGRQPGLAGGINGASRAYCSSLRACPAPKSPTRVRLSAVHTACLREGLFPSRTGRRPARATRSPRRRRLLKRPLITTVSEARPHIRPRAVKQRAGSTMAGWEERFGDYVERLGDVLGHADRRAPLRSYTPGLLLPGERKSVEPMAA